MAGYEVVDPPRGLSYAGPLIDFSAIGNLPKKYYEGKQDRRQEDIATAFKDGLPIDPATGQPSYAKMMEILAQKGDIGAISRLAAPQLDQTFLGQAGQMSPLLGGGSPTAPSSSIPAAAAPQGLPAVRGGGDSPGSVVAIVTSKLPQDSPTTGVVLTNIAKAMGVDPNAPLTAEQSARAAKLTDAYLQRTAAAINATPAKTQPPLAPPQVASATQPALAPQDTAPASFADRFAGAPSVDSATPAPGTAPARTGGYTPPPPPPRPAQAAPAAPAQQPPGPAAQAAPMPPRPVQTISERQPEPPAQPLVPAVPLPPGYTDPQKAILALRREAARLATNPRAEGQVKALDAWATRIESSLQPIKVGQSDTVVDPASGRVLFQGPAASLFSNRGTSGTIDADAERYRQTGQLPPNMGRGIQGQQEAQAIRARAVEHEINEGGDPTDWPSRWQQFGTRAAGLRTFEQRAAGLTLAENEAKRLIPRVQEISKRISRTEYPTLNSLILAAKKGTGGTDVIRLGIAVESLLPVYARVLKPVGQITEGDTNRAHGILDKAWSDGQIDAALDQMNIELDSAKDALKDAREEFGAGRSHSTAPKQPAAPARAAPQGGTGADQNWVTLPSGVRIREK